MGCRNAGGREKNGEIILTEWRQACRQENKARTSVSPGKTPLEID